MKRCNGSHGWVGFFRKQSALTTPPGPQTRNLQPSCPLTLISVYAWTLLGRYAETRPSLLRNPSPSPSKVHSGFILFLFFFPFFFLFSLFSFFSPFSPCSPFSLLFSLFSPFLPFLPFLSPFSPLSPPPCSPSPPFSPSLLLPCSPSPLFPPLPCSLLSFPTVRPQHVRNVHARWDRGTGSQVVHVSCLVQNVDVAAGSAGAFVPSLLVGRLQAVFSTCLPSAFPSQGLLGDGQVCPRLWCNGRRFHRHSPRLSLFSNVSPQQGSWQPQLPSWACSVMATTSPRGAPTTAPTIISTTVPMIAPAGAEGANSTQAHNISPTTEESSRNWTKFTMEVHLSA